MDRRGKYSYATAFDNVNRYAEADTEHAHQVAVFMWAAQANALLRNVGNPEKWRRAEDWAWCADEELSNVQLAWTPDAIRALRLMFAIPNGGERAAPVASRMKAEGVKSGVSDIMLPVARVVRAETIGGWVPKLHHGLFLEMKRPEVRAAPQGDVKSLHGKVTQAAGKLRPEQVVWFADMAEEGYATATAWTFSQALAMLWSYLH